MKSKILLTSLIMVTAIVLSAGALFVTKDDHSRFLEQRAEVVMREIGHRILLHAGDSTSRVLPVKRMSPSIFQIEFQSEFTFVPDTLVEIVHSSLFAAQLPLKYIVNVFDCGNQEMIYGYEIVNENLEDVACIGRIQPHGCYTIQIAFTDWSKTAGSPNTHYLLLIALAGVAGLTFIGREYFKKPVPEVPVRAGNSVSIGKYSFDPERRVLMDGTETVTLSEKESRLLHLFACAPNQVLSRDYLLKEIWENEGVFVGRSLDMFVSKLRKKLQNDPKMRISNIHGKGYKLEIDS
jgi:DNA-binding winged helix-turn-helix (wHTH) protein